MADGAEDTNRNGKVDTGERDPRDAADDATPIVDADGDGLSDDQETSLGTNPNDADSDDDGVLDGDEPNVGDDSDGDGLINGLDHDSDNDGLFDGTERGVAAAPASTDVSQGHFIPDADPGSQTNPLLKDTDKGGVSDGDRARIRTARSMSASETRAWRPMTAPCSISTPMACSTFETTALTP